MKKSLAFNIPFSNFSGTHFINCFTSAYMFVEKMDLSGLENQPCKKRPDGVCVGCGSGCGETPASLQNKYFFWFDTMCGHSSLRWRFDGAPTGMQLWISGADPYECGTDETIDFLFGFAGYEFQKSTAPETFKAAIVASIDAGKPVIAKVRTGEHRFRVITGHDGDALLQPDYAHAQNKPEAPVLGELKTLYLFGEKTTPRYTFKHGLERIVKVMEYNLAEKLWDGYFEKIGWYGWNSGDGMNKADLAEKKKRMNRVAETMWHTFNSHNFAEVFRARHFEELKNPAFDDLCRKIGGPWHGYTHDLCAGLIGFNQQLDWTNDWFATGFAEIIERALKQIEQNDAAVLGAVKQMLATPN